jgi:hypothetical protein
LPSKFNSFKPEPLDFFKLFFTDETIDILVENTNLYALSARAKAGHSVHGNQRHWASVNRHDISVSLALTVHIGLNGGASASVKSFWDFSGTIYHRPMCIMTHFRYTQIRKYFHVSKPTGEPLPDHQWFMKVSPLFEQLRTSFKKYCIPSQNVSIDEMMERFTGRSKHTLKMPNKPIGEGFKS